MSRVSPEVMEANGWKQAPEPCKNCEQAITYGMYPLHLTGNNTGKHRCDPVDSGQPYGLDAEPDAPTT